MYNTIADLVEEQRRTGEPLHRIILKNEMELSELSEDEIYNGLKKRYEVMVASANKALQRPQKMVLGLIEGQASRQQQYVGAESICGPFLNELMAMALSCSEVNASMGRICAAPTAGSCGILPAVLLAVAGRYGSSEKEILSALLVAGGFGAVIVKNATVSGAEGGCQAECGAAAAMAAAAAVTLAGGTAEMAANACGIALMNVMGLVCDPVAGLVQLPCSYRNASGAVNAVLSADLALAGQSSVIPADQCVDAMYRVGKKLPMELRETALGGIASQPAGKAYAKQLKEIGKI
ncbi:L-serine ammonia-lyase, iron-sulfur-dependent, subunit alpha [Anaerofilum sp. BX8]|uniref:L-serine dehydratase n=1 Tax=Anaerofilum hominis TaxID=2763016 RepID=A0A923L1J1_9FIRM|nr:L-serine ammonia-lyase, iron-sulfur-dependent, subunit alpha [Anaerofilum hominis]MBC5581453.1 L-serine ammonia-lyase, iron-sulfur-dependent, subunit alpha [Anaerofilum hominis]